jgi:hypothetical protein
MKISRADWRDQTRNRWGYTVVVTRYTGRSTVVETFGPFNRNDALKAVWQHGHAYYAEMRSVDDGETVMTVGYGRVSYR